MQGLIETLEAEVRSKFQTERRMRDAARGIFVEVPFDNATVKYLWLGERELKIAEVSLSKTLINEDDSRSVDKVHNKDSLN